MINEWGFRATKKEWTDLPEKLPPIIREVEMSKPQQRAYDEMADEFVAYVNGEHIEAQIVITQLLKLQQISSGFIVNSDKEVIELVPTPPKLEVLRDELVQEIEGKMLVFTHFRHTTFQLRDRLRDDLNPAMLIGGMSDDEIAAQKRMFAEDATCRTFIIQDETGKYGHTLLGDQSSDKTACCTTTFYENSYSLDTRLQAEDRNHRHGQTRPVSYFDFVSSPVELKAIMALQRKEDVASAVIDGVRRK